MRPSELITSQKRGDRPTIAYASNCAVLISGYSEILGIVIAKALRSMPEATGTKTSEGKGQRAATWPLGGKKSDALIGVAPDRTGDIGCCCVSAVTVLVFTINALIGSAKLFFGPTDVRNWFRTGTEPWKVANLMYAAINLRIWRRVQRTTCHPVRRR